MVKIILKGASRWRSCYSRRPRAMFGKQSQNFINLRSISLFIYKWLCIHSGLCTCLGFTKILFVIFVLYVIGNNLWSMKYLNSDAFEKIFLFHYQDITNNFTSSQFDFNKKIEELNCSDPVSYRNDEKQAKVGHNRITNLNIIIHPTFSWGLSSQKPQ